MLNGCPKAKSFSMSPVRAAQLRIGRCNKCEGVLWKMCLPIGLLVFIALNNLHYLLGREFLSAFPQHDANSSFQVKYTIWPQFYPKPLYTQDLYNRYCFKNAFSPELEEVFSTHIAALSDATPALCQELLRKFQNIFEVHDRYSSSLHVPQTFFPRVMKWLGGNEELFKYLQSQHLIYIYNLLTSEHVAYNPVRARRPMPSANISISEYIKNLSQETAANCDFCRYNNQTAVDDLGRYETVYSARVSNPFKLERWHCLVITRYQHHPVNFTKDAFVGLVRDAASVSQDVYQREPEYMYPNLAWDTLFHAGASQVHPHIHVMVSPDHYYGNTELLRSAVQRYLTITGSNYFNDLLEIHNAFDLLIPHGNSVAIALLAGRTDLEVMLLSEEQGEDIYELLFYVMKAYQDSFNQFCPSISLAWPASGESEAAKKGRIPAVIRIASRGNCMSQRSDIGAIEIYEVVYRDHDPWQLASAIRTSIRTNRD